MPENPLLPNAKLRLLHTAMVRARDIASRRAAGHEAIFAAVTQLLEPGDAVVSSTHGDALAGLLLPARRAQPPAHSLTAAENPLAFAAGVAAGAQAAGNSRLVALLVEGSVLEPNWAALLAQVQASRLPLIVICRDTPAPSRAAGSVEAPLSWQTLNPLSHKLRFPLLTVDGADAVGMYRAMQESVLRARHGDGPALMWCVMPQAAGKRDPSQAPVARLEGYLAARRISLPHMGVVPGSPTRPLSGRSSRR